jgi:hypothetical protein
VFWGAPLVARELETGTYRLAWTQGVSRARWMAIKLAVVGLISMAVAGLFSLLVTWWASPLDRAGQNIFATFDQRNVVPIGYAAFAFALGVTAGILIRRTLPAMATTLVAFTGARIAMTHAIRPHLIGPRLLALALDPTSMGYGSSNAGPANLMPNPPSIPNAWIYGTHVVDKAGHALTAQGLASACPQLSMGHAPSGGPGIGIFHGSAQVGAVPTGVQNTLQNCVVKLGATFHQSVTYQPASRYWDFQWYELAIFLSAAVVLAGACIWWVRRRLN